MRDADPPSSGTSRPSRTGRRGALALLAGLVGAAVLLPPALRRFVPLEVEPLPALPGFRRIEGEGLTRAFDPLVGLGAPDDIALPAPATASVRADVCAALFPGWDGTSVPLAVFTDYNCAICRRSEPELVQWVAAQNGAVSLYWHELPILGPTSIAAARGALAARRLGAYDAFRARLMRSAVVADAAYLGSLAGGIGLDGDRLVALARSDAITGEIARSLALAHLLELPGTPGAVIGRTVVRGALPPDAWSRLLREESPEATAAACRAIA
jgi:protein-disulfide isomerase